MFFAAGKHSKTGERSTTAGSRTSLILQPEIFEEDVDM